MNASGTITRSHIVRVKIYPYLEFHTFSLIQYPAQPIPLEYLRLASFDGPPEVRKGRADNGSFMNISSTKQTMYPFIIYHASSTIPRRYTLYTPTPTARTKWYNALVDAIGVRKARQDANKVFALPHQTSIYLLIKLSGMDHKN